MRTLLCVTAIALLTFPACDDSDGDTPEPPQEVETEDSEEAAVEEKEELAKPQPVDGPIELSIELDDEQQNAAEELAEGLEEGNFDREVRTVDNAPLFLELAARNDDPDVVAASLHALAQLYRPAQQAKDDEYIAIDDDYTALVATHLRSHQDQVLNQALDAANQVMSDEEAQTSEIIATLIHWLASPRPEVSFEAVEVLGEVPDWEEESQIVNAFVDALDRDEAYVVSHTLSQMRHRTNLADVADELWKPVLEATEFDDPGVRGRAIEVLARLPGWGFNADEERKESAGQRAMEMLDDDHPFVRSRAAEAIGRVDYAQAIPTLVEMADDHSENRYNIDDWTRLDGRSGRLHHDGSAWSRVSDAALSSLSRIRLDDRDLSFDYDSPGIGGDTEEHLAAQAEAAQKWFAEHEDALRR